MASTTTTVCDRCGEIIREARTLFRVETGRLRQAMAVVDLCGPCSSAFSKFLKAGQPEPTSDLPAVTEEETASA